MRENRDCFCMPYSGRGAELAWMLTAMPLKQGMVAAAAVGGRRCVCEGGVSRMDVHSALSREGGRGSRVNIRVVATGGDRGGDWGGKNRQLVVAKLARVCWIRCR